MDQQPSRDGRLGLLPSSFISSPSGSFNGAHDFIIQQATFLDGTHQNDYNSIGMLARHTIPGAEFNSSERYPPPSCHPGTRLDISGNIISWMRNPARTYKAIWLHGPAGVGKSAVIQTLAESESDSQTSILGATLFFSRPAERNDPQQVFNTIAYQLAAKYQPYRRYVVELLTADPKLVKKSLVEQFKRLIVKPFAEQKLLEGETILITLDGLDECEGESAQRDIISLITKFSLQHHNTPLIWIIASRPEPHISTAFSLQDIQGGFLEIDMPIDSDQACLDVEGFLRDKFTEIRENYSMSFSSAQQWPTETEFIKVATHASGLFVFADTVVRFVEDAQYSNPFAQLQKVVNVLDTCLAFGAQENPFAALDALYTRILSGIHPMVLPITRKLLTLPSTMFLITCNLFAISQADAYSALRKLHSVLKVPPPGQADSLCLKVFHTSFADYLYSPARSGSFWVDPLEESRLWDASLTRVLSEAHDIVESTVQSSRINISWDSGGTEPTQKNVFFYLLIELLYCRPSPLEYDKLDNFFQDIDYANLGLLLPNPSRMATVLYSFCDPHLVPPIKRLGIYTTIPLQSLAFGSIGLNAVSYIFSDRRDPLPGQEGLEWSQDTLTYVPEYFFDIQSQLAPFDVGDWCFKAVALSDDPGWTAHIHQRLTDMANLLPSHPVILLGIGEKTCAIIALNINTLNRLWLYVLPYRQS